MQPDYPGVPRGSGEAQNGAGEGMYVKQDYSFQWERRRGESFISIQI